MKAENVFNCIVKNMEKINYVKGVKRLNGVPAVKVMLLELNDGTEVTLKAWDNKSSVHIQAVHVDEDGWDTRADLDVRNCDELISKLNEFLSGL